MTPKTTERLLTAAVVAGLILTAPTVAVLMMSELRGSR